MPKGQNALSEIISLYCGLPKLRDSPIVVDKRVQFWKDIRYYYCYRI